MSFWTRSQTQQDDVYGTQDASRRGRNNGANTSAAMAFELVTSNPALYRSELVNGLWHGDDFVTAAAED